MGSNGWVVDASVAVKLFVEEPLSDHTHRLFLRLLAESEARLVVPDLFYIECANILWKYTKRYGMPKREARNKFSQLKSLPLTPIPTIEILEDALDLATRCGSSVYDACYVAAAMAVEVPLITADKGLVEAASSLPVDLLLLGDDTRRLLE